MVAIQTIHILFQIYMLMLFGRILCSWVPELNESRFMQFLRFYTDPYLNIFRSIIPPLGMMDFSPIVAFLALGFIEKLFIYITLYFIR